MQADRTQTVMAAFVLSLLVLIGAVSGAAAQQTALVAGEIVDAFTDEPISGALITTEGSSAVSDEGEFGLLLPEGLDQPVAVSAEGYIQRDLSVSVVAGEDSYVYLGTIEIPVYPVFRQTGAMQSGVLRGRVAPFQAPDLGFRIQMLPLEAATQGVGVLTCQFNDAMTREFLSDVLVTIQGVGEFYSLEGLVYVLCPAGRYTATVFRDDYLEFLFSFQVAAGGYNELSFLMTRKETDNSTDPCPIVALYGDEARETALLRQFRDAVLRQTPGGREAVKLFYRCSPALSKLIAGSEAARKSMQAVVDRLLPAIGRATGTAYAP